ncbi:Uncharacterized protein GBIM_12649 [Gryllus bimaculatus]|nr:Uncharacterized protein GBIM_12649 [Gryllus bimaculatus]
MSANKPEEFEDNTFENVFEAHNNKTVDIPKYGSLGSFQHRLLKSSSAVDDESKHGSDIVNNLVFRKRSFHRHWKSKCKALNNGSYASDLKNFEKQILETRNAVCVKVPEYIPKFMEFVDEDPDANFFGNYNWLYTGGCIQHFDFNGNYYLAYVAGKSRNCLHVASLKYDDQLWCIDKSNIQKVTPSVGKGIFEILSVEKNGNNIIGVRQKDSCVIYNVSESIKVSEFFDLQETPLSSFDISSVHDELCVMGMNHRMTFWDMNRKEIPMATYFPSDNPRCDNWHYLLYSADPSVVSIAGRKSLKWMERRSSNVMNSVQLSSLKGSQRDEEISMYCASKRNPCLVYVGSDLNLFLLDIRSLSSVIECWTHYLTSPPLYSCVIPYDKDNEIVCIANQNPGNVVLGFSSKSETWPPVKIPSRLDSLYSLQASGLCLDPSVIPRMALGLTGMTYLKCKSSDVELLTHTAASDIFSQSLFDQNTEMNSVNLKGLVSTKETLQATGRWNFKKLYNKLTKCEVQPKPPMEKSTAKQPWQLSKRELLEYKDALAPILLEAWEIDKVGGKSSISGEQKVNAWLDSSFNTVYTSQGNNLWDDE